MTVKPISTAAALHFPTPNSRSTSVFENGSRTVTHLPIDKASAQLAIKISSLPKIPSRAPVTDADETLREIGRKTFLYKNSLVPAEIISGKEKTNRELDIFVQKASIYSIVYMMDGNIDPTVALEIVNETCSSHRSALDVYMEKSGCKSSFFKRLFARCYYLIFFRTSLISNTLDTFMLKFLEIMRTELVQKGGGRNVTTLMDKILSESSSFLDFYLLATENYANGINLHGSKDVHISYELIKKFGMSEEAVCRKFAITAVQNFLPKVHFFNTLSNSSWRILQFASFILNNTLGWLVNRGLRKVLEVYIPSVFQSIVKTSIDSTQPSNLPFVVAITQGILEQLRKFKSQLEQKQDAPPAAPTSVPGTEKLPEVVKKLIMVLSKESLQTRKELQQPPESGSMISKEIDKRIEESCVDGCREFFSYLSDPNNSEEIFYLLLNLTNTTFESSPPSTPAERKKLSDKHEALLKQMQREAREVFQMVIHRSVNERFQGPSKSQIKQMTQSFESLQRSRSVEAVQHLLITDKFIQLKIAALRGNSAHKFRMIEELDAMNEAIDSYHSLAVLDDTQKFPNSIQAGIKKTMLRVFHGMNTLLDQITHAKKLHKHHQEIVSFYLELKKALDMLQKPADFKPAEYKQCIRCLRALTSQMESEHAVFDNCLSELETTYENLAAEIKITDYILSLDQKGKGPLPALYQAVKARIKGESAFDRWKPLPAIPEIHSLTKFECDSLQACIQDIAVCKNIDQLNEKWTELKETMNRFYIAHHTEHHKLLNLHYRSIQQHLRGIEVTMGTMQASLTYCIDSISNIVQNIAQSTSEIRIRNVESIPSRIINTFGGIPSTIGVVSGAALGAIAAFLPGYAAYTLLGLTALLPSTTLGVTGLGCAADQGKLAIINLAAVSILTAATNRFPGMNPAIPLIAGSIGGYLESKKLEKELPSYVSNQRIFPAVVKVFDSLYDFIIKPHVWRWGIVDTLKCVHEAYQ